MVDTAIALRASLPAPPRDARALLLFATGAPSASVDAQARPLVLLAGGKTGGHVFPALAVAEELAVRGFRVAWVGAAGGLEERLARKRGLDFHALAAAPLVGRGPLQRVGALLLLLRSGWQARSLVRRTNAAVVVGTGGFVSAPAVLGAWLARRSVLLLEPNAEAGVANRQLSRFADVAALAHEDGARGLRCATFVAGVPVRPAFFAVPPPRVAGARRLLALGGSQGARSLNAALPRALQSLADRGAAVRVLHQTGADHLDSTVEVYRRDFESEGARLFRRGSLEVELLPFVDDVPAAFADAELVVSRAGAITLAELCAAGRPALLVPLELAGGHQERNAEAMARAGAATVLRERELGSLAAALERLLADGPELATMAHQARSLARPDAARQIADRVVELAERVGERADRGSRR